jgi:ABC-type uncharacterized transport system auxiliary subunit
MTKLFYTLACFVCLAACKNNKAEVDEFTKEKIGKDEARKIESYLSQGGAAKAKLSSPLMYRVYTSPPYVEFPDSLMVQFYNDTLGIETTLWSKYGKYYEGEGKVYLKDSIKVINHFKGDTLYCDEMWWLQNDQRFTSDKNVQHFSRNGRIWGVGFDSKQDLSKYAVYNIYGYQNVTGDGLK